MSLSSPSFSRPPNQNFAKRSHTIAPKTFKTLTTHQPSYIHDLLQLHCSSRQLRSASHNLLEIPRMRTGFAQCSFTYSAPHIWNRLPHIISGNLNVTANTFQKKLKTFYYTCIEQSLSDNLCWTTVQLLHARKMTTTMEMKRKMKGYSLVMKLTNSDTHSWTQSFASFAICDNKQQSNQCISRNGWVMWRY